MPPLRPGSLPFGRIALHLISAWDRSIIACPKRAKGVRTIPSRPDRSFALAAVSLAMRRYFELVSISADGFFLRSLGSASRLAQSGRIARQVVGVRDIKYWAYAPAVPL
jgi:hypothetical protein